ncbi:restriction endonuclease subunit S [Cecembia rubra]|uniref:Type I restriction enzyme S subunit n=1 Tax=Cecembia rubra TaxID=1485585 RepID=A0A2P8DVH0_9BACT|nr:restriction endonuclease subunit S [Cecembia rubra]PSL01233.1 type I restriction enzyme S subunit [Cecembia rubra]
MRSTRTKPVLRFPEFKEDWKECKLSDFLTRYSETNKDEEFSLDEILSLSSHYGIVSRKELLEETYSNVNHLSYKKTRLNDLVYGKSISASYPYGLFKVNDYKDGLLSTLYYTFKVKENVFPKFIDCYFSHLNRANNFLRKYVLVGDRYITADADYLLSGKIYLPSQKDEQKKISDSLIQIDKRIAQLKEKKENLELYKKGITQKLFSQKLRFKDENGKDFPEWEIKKLKDVFSRKSIKNKGSLIKNVLTNSATRGIISQGDYFDKDIANQNNLEGYYIVEVDDFVYNPRISVSAPVGPLKRNHLVKGVMSPLYTVLKPKSGNLCFYEHYFQTSFWFKYMRGIANYGVRHDRMNITNEDFEKLPLPYPHIKEQEKIASFLNEISKQIALVNEQLEETRNFKKALLSKLFC